VSVRRRVAVVVGLAALVAAGALVAVLVLRDDGSNAALDRAQPIEARVVVSPRVVLFGDTVTARVQVALDRARIDPDSLRVETEFTPWQLVRAPQQIRRDGARATYLESVYVLRCLGPPCVPTRASSSREFQAAKLSYAEVGGGRTSTEVRWPVLVVNTRLVSDDFGRRDEYGTAWRADLATLPPVSYRVPPALLLSLLLAGAAVLLLAGGTLAYAALPRREEAAPPPEPPAPPPPLDLTPLERALALLEEPTAIDGAAERRRALEFVAEHFDEQDRSLAASARSLAWRSGKPAPADSVGLAARVREHLAQEAADEERAREEDDATQA
jgi:hypothetical protein